MFYIVLYTKKTKKVYIMYLSFSPFFPFLFFIIARSICTYVNWTCFVSRFSRSNSVKGMFCILSFVIDSFFFLYYSTTVLQFKTLSYTVFLFCFLITISIVIDFTNFYLFVQKVLVDVFYSSMLGAMNGILSILKYEIRYCST